MVPTSSGMRLPTRSLTEPITSWPMQKPRKHALTVISAAESVVPRSAVIRGIDGRWKSIASGGMSVSSPINKTVDRDSART